MAATGTHAWSRIVRPPRKRPGHIVFNICSAAGQPRSTACHPTTLSVCAVPLLADFQRYSARQDNSRGGRDSQSECCRCGGRRGWPRCSAATDSRDGASKVVAGRGRPPPSEEAGLGRLVACNVPKERQASGRLKLPCKLVLPTTRRICRQASDEWPDTATSTRNIVLNAQVGGVVFAEAEKTSSLLMAV